ncbi:MAG TPA: Rpn family recombination-promoting nuclease/putative transposase [Alphaproteobacteria bacterium]|nr:Rpn family recombination-promoting nuclease/putative transposase [Alphaproteobacteria bacterium]
MMIKKHFFKNILFISLSLLMVTSAFETWGMDSKRPDESEERHQTLKKPRLMVAVAAERSPGHSDKEDSPSLRIPLPDFADPTRDTAFKHLLSVSLDGHDSSIASSFLNAFVPDFQKDPIEELYEQPLALPALARRSEKSTFMDFHVRTKSGAHIIIEMQVRRHVYFDERALFYAASVFSRQLSEKELEQPTWYKGLMPIYAVQILGYDSNRARGIKEEEVEDTLLTRIKDHPMHPDQFIKHFKMTDQQSGQTIDHLQMIQIELPRAKKPLFPPSNTFTEQDWWLSLFKHATEYKSADLEGMASQGLMIPDVINKALDRLRLSKWVPELVHAYEKETVDFDEYATMFATERAEGRAEGENIKALKTARKMIKKKMHIETIIEFTELTRDKIEQLIKEEETREDK